MDIGFETIGNATLIAWDHVPVLVTDPWIVGGAYFGSWGLSHEIPPDQADAIRRARYVWLSHGHPDHMSNESLVLLKGKQLLLPDHAGARIVNDLLGGGYECQVLRDREWVSLSPRIKVMCTADYNQDAVLLVDINGRLVVNQNDASALGAQRFVRGVVKNYPTSFLLRLSSRCSDADMLNYVDPHTWERRELGDFGNLRLGGRNAMRAEMLGTRYFVPFSSFHVYQRDDSIWLRPYATKLEDYADGFKSDRCELLPAFVAFDCGDDSWTAINPVPCPEVSYPAEKFGDDWSEPLSAEDVILAAKYFQGFAHLKSWLGFINLRVGGQDHMVSINPTLSPRGITFEAPRNSLMTSIRYEIFDDMLIGNFMRVAMHGMPDKTTLYPDFAPYVAKYGDNGRARSAAELRAYFSTYRRRAPLDYLLEAIERRTENAFRRLVSDQSFLHTIAKRAYYVLKKP